MANILRFLVILGLFACAIAFVFTFWMVFAALAALSALGLGYAQWRKAAPERERARSEKEWANAANDYEKWKARMTPKEKAAHERRLDRERKLRELEAGVQRIARSSQAPAPTESEANTPSGRPGTSA